MKYFVFLFLISFFQLNAQVEDDYDLEIDKLSQKSREFYYTNKDSVYFYLHKIYQFTKVQNQWEDEFFTLINWNRQAGYFYDLEKMNNNLLLLDSLWVKNKKKIEDSPQKRLFENSLLYDKGNYYFKLDEFLNARKAFKQIVDSTEKLPDSVSSINDKYLLSTSYSFLAKMFSNEGKYELAKQFYLRNIRFLKSSIPEDERTLHRNYSLLAEVHKREKNFKVSNGFLLKSLKLDIDENGSLNSLITDGFHLVENYVQLSKLDSAKYYLKLIENKLPPKHPFRHKYHEAKAGIHQKNAEFDLAIAEYKNAVSELEHKWGKRKHDEFATVYNKIGIAYMAANKPKEALEMYDFAIQQLSQRNANKTSILKTLKNKNSALISINSYLKTIETTALAINILDSLKPSFKNHNDKLLLIEDAFPLFESGLEAVYNLNGKNAGDSIIDKAFYYLEKSKSVLLLEALLNAKATEFANIPHEVLERESQLKSKITFIEKKLNTSKTENSELEGQLLELKNDHLNLIQKIESNYPAYYNLKYGTKVISLTKTQELLEKDELLISFFYGNNAIYAISLENNTKKIIRIPIDSEFETSITRIYRMLSDPKSDAMTLGRTTYAIYEQLLAPFLKSTNQKKVIIMADGLLNYIPFAALNTNPEGINYLAENHAISYVNSATLLSELRQRQPKEHTVLAFAPSFDGTVNVNNADRGKLLPLPSNKKEVEQILSSFDGRSYIDEDASLLNFKSQLSSFGMVHLATHAIFDDTAPEYSYLAFSQNGNPTEDLLYVADLYNLKIDADLVTLSACESGLGDLKRGEGFMSLARGFFYSGAASIASTLWKINDASSATLMGSFYKNLSKGDAKDIALQKAQLEFLNTNRDNGLSHPYYWSGFVISGNTLPLSQSFNWVWTSIGAIVILVGGLFYFRRRRT
ncbi:CHAT domain-containing protein [Maribacter sp. ANRC-HE7]|uniref:CHAT domain-containing protein n=1 Tax=Maribacter aquimaris TaxID=2737171 RepID=A0ABR7V0X3_9FLAO|nr:CHAT domain-containing tetratricopeptide repeat protein [Maribacter aquimaris]MBD0777361.1 CHAT domain-containing protein [Maribacter aquimaris]